MLTTRGRLAFPILPRNLIIAAAIALVVLPLVGTAGYMLIEGWGFLDAAYMTVITLTTIGFREVQPLSAAGRVFTILLAVAGVGAMFYALFSLFQFLLEGELALLLGVRRMRSQIESLRDHYILCGFGRVGEEIAREFQGRDVPFVIVDANPGAAERARGMGYLVVEGDATQDAVLEQAGIRRARGLLAASDSDAGNTYIILAAKALNPRLYVVSRAARPDSQSRMQLAGADRTISPYAIAGRRMALSALQPLMVQFIDMLALGRHGGRMLAEIEITQASGLSGRRIEEVMEYCRGGIVLGVQRACGEIQVAPPGDMRLETGDRLIVMAEEAALAAIRPADLGVRQRV